MNSEILVTSSSLNLLIKQACSSSFKACPLVHTEGSGSPGERPKTEHNCTLDDHIFLGSEIPIPPGGFCWLPGLFLCHARPGPLPPGRGEHGEVQRLLLLRDDIFEPRLAETGLSPAAGCWSVGSWGHDKKVLGLHSCDCVVVPAIAGSLA